MAKRFNEYELLEFAAERLKAWILRHTPNAVRKFFERKLKPKFPRKSDRTSYEKEREMSNAEYKQLTSKVDKMELLMGRVYLEELLVFEDDLTGKLPEKFEQ